MQNIGGVYVWGDPVDEGALNQAFMSMHRAEHVALMADHHKGYAVPIGGVIGYKDKVSPSGVGYDIACGNKAVCTNLKYSDLEGRTAKDKPWIHYAMDLVWKNISFGVGRKNPEPVDHELFDDEAWQIKAVKQLRDRAASQLGTVGSGNHYVDIFVDENDAIWIGVHFGSRGFGHGIATHYLKAGGAADGMDVIPLVLDIGTPIADEYVAAMKLAGRYAYAGRDWVCARVAKLLGTSIKEEVHNHHNFAWEENGLWVVRKGATPAFPGQKGFIGGSMGENAVIVEGVASDTASLALNSTVHGAGRVMSRTEAKGKIKNGKVLKEGKVSRDMMLSWLQEANVELRGAGTDESPHCYKRLPEVLKHHEDSIRVLHTLKPLGVAMAGEREYDPYKD